MLVNLASNLKICYDTELRLVARSSREAVHIGEMATLWIGVTNGKLLKLNLA